MAQKPNRTKISRQLCDILIPKFLGLYGRYPATVLKFKKKYFSVVHYGYINILCHIFNSVRNNQQQLMVSASVCFGGKERLHFIPWPRWSIYIKIVSSIFKISCSQVWAISASCDLKLWPTDPKSWPFHLATYRVAQIKIPHQTKCNLSTTCEIIIPKFLALYGRAPATILNFFYKLF